MNQLTAFLFQTILLIGAIASSFGAFGQNERTVLEEYISEGQHDTLRVFGYVALGKTYRRSNPSKAIYYFDVAEKLIEKKLKEDTENQEFYYTELTKVYNGIGVVYRNFGNYEQSFKSYSRSLELLKEHENKWIESSVLFNMGLLNKYQEDYLEAVDFYLQSIKLRKEIKDTVGLSNCYRHIGWVKDKLNETDQAADYFSEGIRVSMLLKDTSRAIKIYEFYAQMYLSRNDLIRAEALLNSGMVLLTSKKLSVSNHPRLAIPLCEVHYKNGDIEKGISICKESISWIEGRGASKNLSRLFQLMSDGYRRLGDFESSNSWLSSRIHNDSLFLVEENIAAVVRTEMNYLFGKERVADSLQRVREKQISGLKLKEQNATIERGRTRVIALVVGIVLLLVIALFGYRNYLLKRRALELKEKDVEGMSLQIKRESAWIDKLVELNNKVKKNTITDTKEQIEQLVGEMKDNLVVDKHRQVIAKNIDVVSVEFKNKLKDRFPNLTKTEIEMCELIRLEMSNLEIAKVRDISQNSARMARYRLRKKLNIPTEESISEVLKTI